jgi:hypothetical protein
MGCHRSSLRAGNRGGKPRQLWPVVRRKRDLQGGELRRVAAPPRVGQMLGGRGGRTGA